MSCLLPPPCAFCMHYLGDDDSQDRDCLAFEEIPDEIIEGIYDHTSPYAGDNNILFKLDETQREDYEEIQRIRKELNRYRNEQNSLT
ncbi:MAG TPA: hypothetical protein ENJ33_05005 [Thiothrix sp.]|nr:hypothetical protein [Thiothrix sp.]